MSEPRIAGIPKADLAVPNPPADQVTEAIDNVHLSEGIPREVLQMFEIDLNSADMDTLTKMRDISTYAMDGELFVGDGLVKLREMLDRIPTQVKNKHEAVWNLISMQRKIDLKRKEVVDLEKRKSALLSMGANHRRPY